MGLAQRLQISCIINDGLEWCGALPTARTSWNSTLERNFQLINDQSFDSLSFFSGWNGFGLFCFRLFCYGNHCFKALIRYLYSGQRLYCFVLRCLCLFLGCYVTCRLRHFLYRHRAAEWSNVAPFGFIGDWWCVLNYSFGFGYRFLMRLNWPFFHFHKF